MRPGKKHVSVTGCKSCHIANVLANQKRLNQCAEQKERVAHLCKCHPVCLSVCLSVCLPVGMWSPCDATGKKTRLSDRVQKLPYSKCTGNQKRLNQCAEQKERVRPEALFSEKSLLQQVLGLRPRTA